MNSFRRALEEIRDAASHEFGVGLDQNRAVMYEARKQQGMAEDGPRFVQMKDSYRTPQAIKAALNLGKQDPYYAAAREKENVEFQVDNRNQKIGTVLGSLGADITNDSARRFWWLVNAAQATGDMIAEQAIARARPAYNYDTKRIPGMFDKDYIGSDLYRQKVGETKQIKDDYTGETKTVKDRSRQYGPGLVQLSAVPAGVAINTGLGLMTPFGGAEGYKAALPSEEDPTKTSNVLGEMASKYILGRTGDLLPYNEFVKVRPDVSADEYGRYKAFKYDKNMDLNPLDGDVTAPMGAVKFTDEGIHGPEVQFLGRSLPVTTGITPFVGAVAGGMLGVSRIGPETGKERKSAFHDFGSDKPIRRGSLGATAGLAAGQVLGNIIEAERRRRNTVENELDGSFR